MKKRLMLIALSLSLIACGGGGGANDSSSNDDSNMPTGTDVLISGGSPDDPKNIVINEEHEISNNPFYNYFEYPGKANEKIIIHSSLTIPLSDLQKARCSQSGATSYLQTSSNDTQINVYDSSSNEFYFGVCGEDLTVTLPETKTYTFNFKYPSNGSGVFNISSITNDSAVSSSSGTAGSPSAPKQLSTSNDNVITNNSFMNYYQYTANEGDRLIVNVLLDQPLSDLQKARCSQSGLTTDLNPKKYVTQINVYDSLFNDNPNGVCGEELIFVFPETGTYIFQFSYANNFGTFNAALVN